MELVLQEKMLVVVVELLSNCDGDVPLFWKNGPDAGVWNLPLVLVWMMLLGVEEEPLWSYDEDDGAPSLRSGVEAVEVEASLWKMRRQS